jgi:hypothetical protein
MVLTHKKFALDQTVNQAPTATNIAPPNGTRVLTNINDALDEIEARLTTNANNTASNSNAIAINIANISNLDGRVGTLESAPSGGGTFTDIATATTIYIDSVNGSDTNNGLTAGTAFQTIAKLNEYLRNKRLIGVGLTISILGTFTNAILDFSDFDCNGNTVSIINTDVFNKGIFAYTIPVIFTKNNSNLRIIFNDLIIQGANLRVTFENVKGLLSFNGTYFQSTSGNSTDWILKVINCHLDIPACTIRSDVNNVRSGFFAEECHGNVDGLTFSQTANGYWQNGGYIENVLSPYDFGSLTGTNQIKLDRNAIFNSDQYFWADDARLWQINGGASVRFSDSESYSKDFVTYYESGHIEETAVGQSYEIKADYLNITRGNAIRVNNVKVIGTRQPAIASPTADLTSLKTAVDALRAMAIAHGLTF